MSRQGSSDKKNGYNQFMETTMNSGVELMRPDRKVTRYALHELQAELRQLYGKRSPKILVYGSYARNEENIASDVDVLLLYPEPIRPGYEIQRMSGVLADLNLRYQVLISILPVEEANYRNEEGVFWQNLRQEGVPIERI
jgi:predicted nucleotidyltransferase